MLRWQGEPDKADKVEDRKRGQLHGPAWDINRALNEFVLENLLSTQARKKISQFQESISGREEMSTFYRPSKQQTLAQSSEEPLQKHNPT